MRLQNRSFVEIYLGKEKKGRVVYILVIIESDFTSRTVAASATLEYSINTLYKVQCTTLMKISFPMMLQEVEAKFDKDSVTDLEHSSGLANMDAEMSIRENATAVHVFKDIIHLVSPCRETTSTHSSER